MANKVYGVGNLGIDALYPPNWNFNDRDPTQYDTQSYNVGDLWLNEKSKATFVLVSLQGSPTSKGPLATWVPWGSGFGGFTQYALPVGNAAGSLVSLPAAMNGQIPIGSDNANPVLATLTAGAGITILNGPGTITISSSGGGGNLTFATPSGNATSSGGTINFAVGAGMTISGAGSTVTFSSSGSGGSITVTGGANIAVSGSPVSLGGTLGLSLPPFTQYELVTATGSPGVLESLPAGVGIAGQLLTSRGPGQFPTWSFQSAITNGQWVPVVSFYMQSVAPTWTYNNCYYTRVGNAVIFNGVINVTNFGVAPNDSLFVISGLPIGSAGNVVTSSIVAPVVNTVGTTVLWEYVVYAAAPNAFTNAFNAINNPSLNPIKWSNFGMGAANWYFYFSNTYIAIL